MELTIKQCNLLLNMFNASITRAVQRVASQLVKNIMQILMPSKINYMLKDKPL